MSKHTLGPWTINEWQQGDSGSLFLGIENGVKKFKAQIDQRHFNIVASTEHLGTSLTFGSFEGCHIAKVDITYDGYEEALANARILAAAPELLDNLITTNTALILAFMGRKIPENIQKVIEENRALIEKAQGR